jgi:hypothetical protein
MVIHDSICTSGRAQKSWRDTRDTTIYTGSGLRRVKPYVQFGGGIMRESATPEEGAVDVVVVPLRGAQGRLILAGDPWVTSRFPSILVGYNRESLSELVCLVLYSKLSSCSWAHMSGRGRSTNRSAGLLVGRARLSGTVETLVGGDPWVPMSLKPQIDV